MIGVFGTMWASMQFFASPVLGALSDRFGRRPVVLLSNFGLGFDYILMALAPTLGWLFVGRMISGVTSASIATAFAYIADVTPPEKRARSRSVCMGAAFGIGFIVGPALGGVLSGGQSAPAVLGGRPGSAWPTACTACSSCRSRCRRSGARRSRGGARIRRARCAAASHPQLIGFAAVHFLYNLAHQSLPERLRAVRGLSLRLDSDGRRSGRWPPSASASRSCRAGWSVRSSRDSASAARWWPGSCAARRGSRFTAWRQPVLGLPSASRSWRCGDCTDRRRRD